MKLFHGSGQDPAPWKSTPEILSKGIYRFSRNPMYVGMALIQTAIALAKANGWMLALVPATLFFIYLTAVRHEEAYLEGKFGDAYIEYKRSVRRWL